MIRNDELNNLIAKAKSELNEGDENWFNDMKKIIELIVAYCISNHDEKFIGFFLSKMNREYDTQFKSFAGVYLNNGSLYMVLNPVMILKTLSLQDIIDIITHEVYHIVMNHLGRGKYDFDQEAANIAMDTSINQFINFGENLSKVVCTPESIKEEFAIKQDIELKKEYDYYYDLIINSPNYNKMKEKRKENSEYLQNLIDEINKRLNNGEKIEESENESNKDNNGSNSSGESEGSSENNTDSNSPSGESSDNNDSNGSSSQSSSNNNSNNKKSKKDLSNMTLKELLDELEKFLKNNKVTISHNQWKKLSPLDKATSHDVIRDLLQEAKDRGILPSDIKNTIDDMYFKEPIISWKTELRYTIGSIPVPYRKTMRVKNRRQPYRADILGRVPDRKVNMTIAFDTSGSVSDDEIKYFFNEVFNIIKDTKTEITLIECDAQVNKVSKLNDKKDLRNLSVTGRGGTYFTPVFEYIKNNMKKTEYPDILIFFTDGYGESEIPANLKPNCEVMWVLTGSDEKNLSVKNPFTNKVRILNIEGKKFH